MAGSVTLQLTTGSSEVGNFTIYCESADPGNEIAQNVSSASLAAGYCTDEICNCKCKGCPCKFISPFDLTKIYLKGF